MNISAKKLVIAVGTILLCIVATLFWPGSNRQKQKDKTIGAAVLLPVAPADSVRTGGNLSEPKPQPPSPAPAAQQRAMVTMENGVYTVQVASWRSRWKAERDRQRYADQGFEAYIQRVDLPEKGGVWHRVRIGHFSSAELATGQAEALQDMLQAGYWIATR